MQFVRLGKWTFVAVAAALGAAVAGEKAFDIRGESLQRDGSKLTVTLVRVADAGTGALQLGVAGGSQMAITIKLSSGANYSIKALHPISDSVGMLGAVNGAALEQVVFVR